MEIRFYLDPESGKPHVASHGVAVDEVRDVLERPIEDRAGRGGARVALGRTHGGRFLRVVYVPESGMESIFVLTAYEPGWKVIRALRRRLKRRP